MATLAAFRSALSFDVVVMDAETTGGVALFPAGLVVSEVDETGVEVTELAIMPAAERDVMATIGFGAVC